MQSISMQLKMKAKALGEEAAEARPYSSSVYHNEYYPETKGLTKREKFAMAAMQGLLAGRLTPGDVTGKALSPSTKAEYLQAVSETALDYADALLIELAQERP